MRKMLRFPLMWVALVLGVLVFGWWIGRWYEINAMAATIEDTRNSIYSYYSRLFASSTAEWNVPLTATTSLKIKKSSYRRQSWVAGQCP